MGAQSISGTSNYKACKRMRILALAAAAALAAMLAFGATGAFAEEASMGAPSSSFDATPQAEDVASVGDEPVQDDITPQATATTMVLQGGYSSPYTGSAVAYAGEAYVFDSAGNIISGPALTYACYTDKACTVLTTAANSGAASDGAAPVNRGIWYVKASYAGDATYSPCSASIGYGITTVDSNTGLAYLLRDDTAPYGAGAYMLDYTGTSKDVVVPAQLGGQNVVWVQLVSHSLSSLDVSACGANLKFLDCTTNEISSLDVSENTALVSLTCGNNKISSLNLGDIATLEYLACGMNKLSSLDVSKNTALAKFYCFQNELTSLDISANTALKDINCSDNKLTYLNIDKNTALTALSCERNKLLDLDISENTALATLRCDYNFIADPDTLKTIIDKFGTNGTVPQYITGSVEVGGISESYAHTGAAIKPEPTVNYYNDSTTALTKDTDYTVA